MNYYHPDMLLKIPDGYVKDGKIPLSLCKKLVFADPYACMIFQRERMEDLGEAHNFRVKMAQYHCSESEAREIARRETFQRVCIFGLGTTGMFIGDLIRQRYPDADRSRSWRAATRSMPQGVLCAETGQGRLRKEQFCHQRRTGGGDRRTAGRPRDRVYRVQRRKHRA